MNLRLKSLLYDKYNVKNYYIIKTIIIKNKIPITPEYYSLFDYITYYDDAKILSIILFEFNNIQNCIKYSILHGSIKCLTHLFDRFSINSKMVTFIIKIIYPNLNIFEKIIVTDNKLAKNVMLKMKSLDMPTSEDFMICSIRNNADIEFIKSINIHKRNLKIYYYIYHVIVQIYCNTP